MTPDLQATLDAVMARSVRERGPRWACRTLEAIGQARLALAPTRPLQGRTAIVVGAGPSLDLAGPHLPAWQRAGACIIATNTAARACVAYGLQPDVVCLAETDPNVACHLDGVTPGVSVLSTYASQEAIDAANAVGPLAFAMGPEPALVPMAARLGITPLWYSGCVAVMGVAVARFLGAHRIVLAGVDGAYTDRMYGKHTPFADLYPHVEPSFQTSHGVLPDLVITRTDHKDQTQASKRRTPSPAIWVENNAGGQSLTEAQLLAPCDLFVPAGKGCDLVTMSPHGVALEGVRFADASDIDVGRFETRASVGTQPIGQPVAYATLRDVELELQAWEPHDSVYATARVPLATYWATSRNRNPLKKLAEQRALMAKAKGAMLEAVANGIARCT